MTIPADFLLRPTLSKAEETFEHWRRTIGLFLGPAACVAVFLAPIPGIQAHRLAAVLAWVVVWWITEPVPIPVSALLGLVLCVLTGVAPASKAFGPLADPIIYLFLGSFMIARAMSVHGLDRRFAFGIMSLPAVGTSPARLLFTFGAVAAFVSMWISNTATTAMLAPIGLGIVYAVAGASGAGDQVRPGTQRFGTGMMLMAAYAASAGGIGTPVGTPPNLIGLALIAKTTGVRIPFFQWMALAVPCLVVVFLLLFVLLYLLHRPEPGEMSAGRDFVRKELVALGPWTKAQKNTLFAFLVTVTLWITPGFLSLVFGSNSPLVKSYSDRIPESVAALIGAILLFLLPADWPKRVFTLDWRQAVRIDWGTLVLFGAGVSLGNQMFESGLANMIGRSLLNISGATSLEGMTLVSIVLAIVVSEATSNTASANMVVPVMIAIAGAAHLNPIPPAIGATLGASWGFMLPVSTPPNAIVYGSGLVPITRMMRAGFLFDVLAALVLWLGLLVLLPWLGLW